MNSRLYWFAISCLGPLGHRTIDWRPVMESNHHPDVRSIVSYPLNEQGIVGSECGIRTHGPKGYYDQQFSKLSASASRPTHYNFGAPEESRTPKIWFLRPTRIPIPSPGQNKEQMLAGFEPAPASAFATYSICKSFCGYYLLLC